MKFNGIKKDYLRVNMELFRPPTPPILYEKTQLNRNGERVKKRRFGGMDLTVPITIKSAEPIESIKEDISSWLMHNEVKMLEFADSPNRYYLACYHSMDLINRNPYYAKGSIVFYLPVAYRFGLNKQINVTTSIQTQVITGQMPTPWTSHTRFNSSTSQYTLETNLGGKIILNYEFIAGDVLTIDYENRVIKLNGRNIDVGLSLESVWFELEPGDIIITASHPTELTYSERFY